MSNNSAVSNDEVATAVVFTGILYKRDRKKSVVVITYVGNRWKQGKDAKPKEIEIATTRYYEAHDLIGQLVQKLPNNVRLVRKADRTEWEVVKVDGTKWWCLGSQYINIIA